MGYEVNKKIFLRIRFNSKKFNSVIGVYENCFDRRTIFIYKTQTECEGLSIKKKEWKELEDVSQFIYK
jgi:hypothetical protein